MEELKNYLEKIIEECNEELKRQGEELRKRRNEVREMGDDHTADFEYQEIKVFKHQLEGQLLAYEDCLKIVTVGF